MHDSISQVETSEAHMEGKDIKTSLGEIVYLCILLLVFLHCFKEYISTP